MSNHKTGNAVIVHRVITNRVITGRVVGPEREAERWL
jgi:hypothetical protein